MCVLYVKLFMILFGAISWIGQYYMTKFMDALP